jgi:hypothetical protein
MREYVVYRHDQDNSSRAADQAGPEKRPVARLSAATAEEACRLAAQSVPVAPNQQLSAEPADEVDAREHALDLAARGVEGVD